jgi:hypothetical protein
MLAQSTFFTPTPITFGPNDIKPVNSFPFTDATIPSLNNDPTSPLDAQYTDPYTKPGADSTKGNPFSATLLPAGLDPATTIKDPTEVLRAVITSQTIKEADVIMISTTPPLSGILNIPFVGKHANAIQLDEIFWIETVAKDPRINKDDTDPDSQFFQLQYVQRVILDFDNVQWPHVSVATLVKE